MDFDYFWTVYMIPIGKTIKYFFKNREIVGKQKVSSLKDCKISAKNINLPGAIFDNSKVKATQDMNLKGATISESQITQIQNNNGNKDKGQDSPEGS